MVSLPADPNSSSSIARPSDASPKKRKTEAVSSEKAVKRREKSVAAHWHWRLGQQEIHKEEKENLSAARKPIKHNPEADS